MKPVLGRFTEETYALLRVVVGLLFMCHGAQKLFGAFGGEKVHGDPLMTFGGVIELVGGLFVAIGLFASIAAFLASGMMAVAYFKVHAPQGFLPIVNKGELAVLYCFVFFYISARGSGPYSVDRLIARGRP